MTRTDKASRTIAAPLDRVYAALVDPEPSSSGCHPRG